MGRVEMGTVAEVATPAVEVQLHSSSPSNFSAAETAVVSWPCCPQNQPCACWACLTVAYSGSFFSRQLPSKFSSFLRRAQDACLGLTSRAFLFPSSFPGWALPFTHPLHADLCACQLYEFRTLGTHGCGSPFLELPVLRAKVQIHSVSPLHLLTYFVWFFPCFSWQCCIFLENTNSMSCVCVCLFPFRRAFLCFPFRSFLSSSQMAFSKTF